MKKIINKIKPFKATIIAVIVFVIIVRVLLFYCPTLDELREGELGSLLYLFFVLGLGPYIIRGIFVGNKASSKYPEIRKKYEHEIQECQHEFLMLQQRLMRHAMNIGELGLGQKIPVQTILSDETSIAQTLLKFSSVQYSQDHADKLQKCIDFLEQKERLEDMIRDLKSIIIIEIPSDEIETLGEDYITHGIINIDLQPLDVGGIIIPSEEQDGIALRLPLTSRCLKRMHAIVLQNMKSDNVE